MLEEKRPKGEAMRNAYYNGEFSADTDVRIPLTDRCVFFGDGVYDAMIGKGGRIHLCDEHIDRLYRSASAIGLRVSETKEELKNLLYEVVKNSGLDSYFLYVQLTRSSKSRTHASNSDSPANILIKADAHKLPTPDSSVTLTLTEDLRYYMCNVKTLNLLPAVLASTAAEANGFDEAVFVRGDAVTECAHSNIAIVKSGTVITHPDSNLILPGITKSELLKTAKSLSIPIKERPFTTEELFNADSVLVMSTTKLVLEARRIDSVTLPTGKNETSKRLIRATFENYWKSMEER